MRRVPIILVLLALLLSGGCNGVNINWDDLADVAWTGIKEFVTQQLIIGKTKYGDDSSNIKQWVLDRLDESKFYNDAKATLEEYHVTINIIALIDELYEVIEDAWPGLTRRAKSIGVDTGGLMKAEILFYIGPKDFPGIYDIEMD